MMSGQKKKKINKAEVIGKGLLTVLLIALELAIWPGYLVYNNYMSSSYSEYSVYSEPITERTEITQYFKPLYSRLDQIEFALGFEQEAVTDQVLHFVLYDEKNTELMSQDFPLGSMSADHFYALPLGVSLSGKQTYHWTLTRKPQNAISGLCMRNMETVWPRRIYVLKGTAGCLLRKMHRLRPDIIIRYIRIK